MPPCFQVASPALLCYTHSEPASRGSHDAGARAKQALHHGRSQATASSPSSVNIGSVKRWALSDFWWCMHSGTCLKPCKWSALLGVARYPDGRGQQSLRFVFLTASCSHLAASLSLQKPGTSVSLLWAIQSEASSKVSPIITALINAVAPPARWRPAMQCVTMTSPQYKDCRTSGHSSFQAAILDQYLSEPKLALILPYLTNHQGMTTVHPGLPNTRQSYIYIVFQCIYYKPTPIPIKSYCIISGRPGGRLGLPAVPFKWSSKVCTAEGSILKVSFRAAAPGLPGPLRDGIYDDVQVWHGKNRNVKNVRMLR